MVTQKRFRWSNIALGAIVVLFLSGFALAVSFRFQTPAGASNFNISEDIGNVFNISIINLTTTVGANNISYVNISLQSGISFLGPNGSSFGALANFSYDSVNRVLSWFNATTYGGILMNSSLNYTFWFNASVAIPGNYNITVKLYNFTSLMNETTMDVFVNDTNFPTTITPISITRGGNYSGSKVINFTIVEELPSQVLFNISNTDASANQSLVATQSGATSPYSFVATLDTTSLSDGIHELRVIVNDTKGNNDVLSLANNTYLINFTVDNTAPTITTLKSSSSSSSQIVIDITLSDATSGIESSCSESNYGATITGTGLTQTLTHTGISCGKNSTYLISCGDRAGNSGSKTVGYQTSDCSDTGPSTGGTTTTWTQTIVVSNTDFETGYTKELSTNNRLKVLIGSAVHYVGVKSLTATEATIEVSSDPVSVKLTAGQTAKVDINDDGIYDVYVKLNSIASNKANILIQKISEAIPTGAGAVSTTGEQVTTTGGTQPPATTPSNLTWLWVVIAIIIIVAIVAGIAVKKKK